MKDLKELDGKDRLVGLKKIYVSVNARGRQSIEFGTCTGNTLMAWLEERWKLE